MHDHDELPDAVIVRCTECDRPYFADDGIDGLCPHCAGALSAEDG